MSLTNSVLPTKAAYVGPKYAIIVSMDGRHWTAGEKPEQEPLEMIRARLEKQHPVMMPLCWVRVIDQKTREVLFAIDPVIQRETGADKMCAVNETDEFSVQRDAWLDRVMRILLPPKLYLLKDDEMKAHKIRTFCDRRGYSIVRHPNGSMAVLRKIGGKNTVFAQFGAFPNGI